MAHTPGPWWWNDRTESIGTPAGWLCSLAYRERKSDVPFGKKEDDANLVAAAPEMLEAIEEFLQGYEETCRQEHHLGSAIEGALWDVIEPLYEAYRKAKGE